MSQHDLTEDQNDKDLDFVREKRKEIISSMTKSGIPSDTKDVQTLLTALSDMDRAAIGRKRIKVDKDVGSQVAQAAELIATMFADNRVKTLGYDPENVIDVLPVLSIEIPTPILIEGETAQNPIQEDYESFMKRVDGNL